MDIGFAPTWLRQVSPHASQNHFNYCYYISQRSEPECRRISSAIWFRPVFA